MNKMRQISQEFGEPFRDVVKGFAEQGNSITLTAAALGVDRGYFRKLLHRLDLHKLFPTSRLAMRPECRGVGVDRTEQARKTADAVRGQSRPAKRKPITHNGFTWQPGEPTHHYLFAQGIR